MSRSASFEATVEGAGDLPDVEVPIESISNATLRHSALSNVDISTAGVSDDIRRYADFFAAVELRVSLTGGDGRDLGTERIYRGRLVEVETSGSSAVTTLKTVGRLIKLDKSDGFREFSDIRAFEALRRYIDEDTPFEGEVQDDPGTVVVDDGVAFEVSSESEFDDLLAETIEDDEPFDIVDGGALALLPTNDLTEAEDADSFNGGTFSDDNLSGGVGVEFGGIGDRIQHTFEIDYKIPAGEWDVFSRDFHDGESGEDQSPRVRVFVDNTEVAPDTLVESGLDWSSYAFDNDFDLEPGTHTVEIEYDDGDVFYKTDLFGLFDTRFDYNFDNTELSTVDRNHLNGPEAFPSGLEFEWPVVDQETQVSACRIDSSWSGTSGSQQLAASPNAGEEYLTADNSETLDVNFNDEDIIGTDLKVRTTHDRHEPDGPREETPRLGYAGQSIDEIEVRFDQISVAIIGPSGILFAESDLQNIKDLASLARYNFTVDHSADEDRIEAFPIGTEIDRNVEWFTTDWDRRDGGQDYANRVVARGASKPENEREDEDDLRYEAVVRDEDEIQRLVEIGLSEEEATQTTVVTDPELESSDEVQAQAFNALEDVVGERLPSGRVRVVPTFLPPGYAYPVDEFETPGGDVPTKVLEKLSYSEAYGSDASGELEFETPRNWVSGLSPVESDVVGIKRLF